MAYLLTSLAQHRKMKLILTLCITMVSLFPGNAQSNTVFSGGELINYSVVDISVTNGVRWTTERAALPGYFSAADTAAYTGCSNDVHIDGYVKKYGNRSFIFPIGSDNKLRTLEMSAPANATDAYATAWIPGDPSTDLDPTAPFAGTHPVTDFAAPLFAVSTVGQWDWQVGIDLGYGLTGNGEGLVIKVSIPDMTQFATTSQLRLVGWNGTKWIDLSKTATATGNTENSTLQGIMIPGITAIGIGRIYATLPLKLEKFTGISSNCRTILNWKTAGEYNTDEFIVEQSTGSFTYQAVAAVPATGSPNGSVYSITVEQASAVASYRLKMKDKDGTFTYSPVVMINKNCDQVDLMQVFPNPVTTGNQAINLRFTTAFRGKAQFMIFNSISQQMVSKSIQVVAGENLVSADVLNLPKGTYFIKLTGADGTPIGNGQKFIKQ